MTVDRHASRTALLARVAWLALAAGFLIVWLASLPGYFGRVTSLTIEPFHLAERMIFDNALAQSEAAQRGLSLAGSAALTIALDGLQICVYFAIGALILRRATARFAWYTAYVLLGFAVTNMTREVGVAPPFPGALLAVETPGYLVWPLWFLWLVLFPNGRLAPRWARIPVTVAITAFLALQVASLLAVAGILPAQIDTLAANSWSPCLALPLFGFLLGSGVYRFLRVSTPIERQQTKWFLFGIGALFTGMVAFLSFPDFFTATFVGRSFFTLVFLSFPITVAIAILRYRLWDIDVIIRRTVAYAIVSAALAIVYLGANVVAQGMIGALGGQRNEVAIVASTLAVAALFSPVRRRVQNAIDRRFNRQRYDADKVVADFAEYAAHETNLSALQARIVGVVAETIQPQQVTMWVRAESRPTEDRRRMTEASANEASAHSAF